MPFYNIFMSVGSEVSFALNICDVEMSFTTENFSASMTFYT